jgi:hypothetical protein
MPQQSALAAEVSANENRRLVLKHALDGFSIAQIAEETKLSPTHVRELLADLNGELTLRIQELREHWIGVAFARSEKILSKTMPLLDLLLMPSVTAEEGLTLSKYIGAVKDISRIFLDITKTQKELLQLKIEAGGDPTSGNTYVQNNTIVTSGDFYAEALKHIQKDEYGQSFEEYMEASQQLEPQALAAELPGRIDKLQARIDEMFPPDNDLSPNEEPFTPDNEF